MEQPRIRDVSVVGDGYALQVWWADGKADIIDLFSFVDEYAVFEPLTDRGAFAKVQVSDDGWYVEWPGVADDAALESDTLWRLAREQAGEIMTKAAFRAWRTRNGLSLSGAAEALGLSRRQIAYYDSGEKEIPKHILLACIGYEERSAATEGRRAGNSAPDAATCFAPVQAGGASHRPETPGFGQG